MEVLIVEDEALTRMLLTKIVKTVIPDAQVSTAATIKEALAEIAFTTYDLITLDINLPDGVGLTVLEKISRTINSDTPVMVVTGYGNLASCMHDKAKTNEEFFIESGANGFIDKVYIGAPSFGHRLRVMIDSPREDRT